MTLIKKTAVLTNKGAEGYITVVRIGDEVGAKIVGENFDSDMLLGLKIGSSPIYFYRVNNKKTELNLNCTFHHNDSINCTIIKGDNLVAKAGNKININSIKEYFCIPPKSQKKTTFTEILDSEQSLDTQNNFTPKTEIESFTKSNSKKDLKTSNMGKPTQDIPLKDTNKSDSDNLESDFLSRLTSQNSENFYSGIKEKLDELFVIHPADEQLKEAIPDSEWIKIYYDNDDYYVVGKLYDNAKIAYLSYGVPGVKNIAPPKLTKDICQWFQIPNLPSPYEGYYLIFQNAKNGEVEKE
ncbi:MAG: hypothetical protein WCR54_08390 [Clostridia bacterium]